MSYLLLAVVFYTIVKYSFEVWLQLRSEKRNRNREFDLEDKVMELNEEIAELKNPTG